MIKVSIIVPIYNKEKYLHQCLDSIVNQTLKDIEIILVDDGSTDNSLEIINQYKNKDTRIICIEQKNQGAAKARQVAIDIAKGEYLYFIDADDYIELNLCETIYNNAIKNDADIVFFNTKEHRIENNEEKIIYKEKYLENKLYNRDEIIDYILPRTLSEYDNGKWTGTIRWCLWLRFFRSELIKQNNISFKDKFRRCQDLQFTFEATLKAQRYLYLGDEYLYNQNAVLTSLSKGYNKNLWGLVKPLALYLNEKCKEVDYMDLTDQMTICACNFATLCLFHIFNHKEAKIKFFEFYKIVFDKDLKPFIDKARLIRPKPDKFYYTMLYSNKNIFVFLYNYFRLIWFYCFKYNLCQLRDKIKKGIK